MLPGMGANPSMYDFLKLALDFRIEFIRWPKYSGEKTFIEIAERVIEENRILDGDVVGGSSLGGMVAIEIARKRKLAAVVLIGSATNSAEIQSILSFLSPLSVMTPISLIQKLVGKHRSDIAKMIAESDPEFIRAMCLYLRKWEGISQSEISVYRIHGGKDHVIPCPSNNVEIIADAGHLLAVTHPKECGRYLNKLNQQLMINS